MKTKKVFLFTVYMYNYYLLAFKSFRIADRDTSKALPHQNQITNTVR